MTTVNKHFRLPRMLDNFAWDAERLGFFQAVPYSVLPATDAAEGVIGFDELDKATVLQYLLQSDNRDIGSPEKRWGTGYFYSINVKFGVEFEDGQGYLRIPRFPTRPAEDAGPETRRLDDGYIYVREDTHVAEIVLDGVSTPLVTGSGGGAVDSVFGRTGTVVAQPSDYDASQIDNDSLVPGLFVSDALTQLNDDIGVIEADLSGHIAATSGVHGAVGDVVGTDNTQTLNNKTLEAPLINDPNVSGGVFNDPQLYNFTAFGPNNNFADTSELHFGDGTIADMQKCIDIVGPYQPGVIRGWDLYDSDIYQRFSTDGVAANPATEQRQTYRQYRWSPGYLIGGDITDDGDGTVTVGAGEGQVILVDQPRIVTWADTPITPPDGQVSFIGVEYDGFPSDVTVVLQANQEYFDASNRFLLGVVERDGTDLQIINAGDNLNEFERRIVERLNDTTPRVSQGGFRLDYDVASLPQRYPTVTTGSLWINVEEYDVGAFNDPVGPDTMSHWYRDGGGGWTEVEAQTEWNNNQYDDGSGTLATMQPNRWGNQWFYYDIYGVLHMVFGRENETQRAAAEDAPPPDTLPPELLGFAGYIGRYLFQRDSNEPDDIFRFGEGGGGGGGGVTVHGDLLGLAADDHTQYLLADGTRPLAGDWSIDGFNLTNVGGIEMGYSPINQARLKGDYTEIENGLGNVGQMEFSAMGAGDIYSFPGAGGADAVMLNSAAADPVANKSFRGSNLWSAGRFDGLIFADTCTLTDPVYFGQTRPLIAWNGVRITNDLILGTAPGDLGWNGPQLDMGAGWPAGVSRRRVIPYTLQDETFAYTTALFQQWFGTQVFLPSARILVPDFNGIDHGATSLPTEFWFGYEMAGPNRRIYIYYNDPVEGIVKVRLKP